MGVDPHAALTAALDEIALAEGGEMWQDRPSRWFDEGPTWRCTENHVSRRYLKDEELGCVCLACREPIHLTFPEDRDGPLIPPTHAHPV